MLNPSKTEFLLVGLPQQLSKIENPSISMTPTVVLSPVSSARNLGVLFNSNLSLSDHISFIIKSCIFHVRDLRPILDQTTARNIATARSFTLSWTIVTHYFSTFLQINMIVLRLFLILLLMLSQILHNFII
jgi:hypothetical protein